MTDGLTLAQGPQFVKWDKFRVGDVVWVRVKALCPAGEVYFYLTPEDALCFGADVVEEFGPMVAAQAQAPQEESLAAD